MKRAAKKVTDNKGESDFSVRNIVREFNIHSSTQLIFITKQTRQQQEVSSFTSRIVTCGYAKPWQNFRLQEEDIFLVMLATIQCRTFHLLVCCLKADKL
jgi:hypothetical protein